MKSNVWISAFGLVTCSFLVASSVGAAGLGLSVNASAPAGNIIVSQTSNLGPGTQEGNRNFSDNGGPFGQTFTATANGLIGSVSVLSRGNNASGWNNGSLPFTGTEFFGLLIGQVDPTTKSLINTHIESGNGLVAPGNFTGWLTLQLATPVAIEAGKTYAFSIAQWSSAGMYNNGGWFGAAHSDTDVYAGGYAFNLNSSINNAGDNQGMIGSDAAAKRFGFIDPTLAAPGNVLAYAAPVPGNYDYAFAVQAVPEPAALALVGMAAACLIARMRRA